MLHEMFVFYTMKTGLFDINKTKITDSLCYVWFKFDTRIKVRIKLKSKLQSTDTCVCLSLYY